ncbi:MAG: hypothetical protein AAGL49_09605, partial [Pseudomonadota bacterium]
MTSWLLALLGGAMIGAAASLLMAGHGRVMGVSGIVSGLLPRRAEDLDWRLMFILGLLAAPLLASLVAGEPPQVEIEAGPLLLAIAGFTVGVGTVMGPAAPPDMGYADWRDC